MHGSDRAKLNLVSLVTNNAIGDSRVLKSAETLAAAGYNVTLLAQRIGNCAAEEQMAGFKLKRVEPVTKYSLRRTTPLGPFKFTVKIKNSYVRYGSRLIAPDFLFWRWAGPTLLKLSDKFLYPVWPLLKDGEASFAAAIDAENPDLIHANDCDTLGLAMRAQERAAKRGKRIGILYDAHEYVQGVHRKHPVWRHSMMILEKQGMQRAGIIMTVSETIAQMLQDDYKLKIRPTVVLNAPRIAQPAVDADMKTIRTKLGLPTTVPLHVYVGAAAPQRGLDAMVDALVKAPGHHVALVVNPNSPYVIGLGDKAKALGVSDRLHIHPYVPEWYVSTFISDATSGVIPILKYPNHEISLVTKFFEFLHAKLPIIVSDVKTMAAEVNFRKNGLVFTAGNGTELAEKYIEIAEHRDKYVAAITPELLSEYSWERQGDKLVAAHDALALMKGNQ
jgi:glycosyltransferase involved in cell wall biosynthesis